MSEETTDVKEATETEANDPSRVVKEAEHKLKEMSRKAKERKNAQNTRQPKGLSEINYFWLVIGGLGALGVGYLIFGNKGRNRGNEVRDTDLFQLQRMSVITRQRDLSPLMNR